MAGLVELGLVRTDVWSRRRVLQLGGAASAATVAVIALPGIAAAASSTTSTTSSAPDGAGNTGGGGAGDWVVEDGGSRYHAFTTVGSGTLFTVG